MGIHILSMLVGSYSNFLLRSLEKNIKLSPKPFSKEKKQKFAKPGQPILKVAMNIHHHKSEAT